MPVEAQKPNYKVIVPFAEQEIVSINESNLIVAKLFMHSKKMI
jgi:hypothetical protein